MTGVRWCPLCMLIAYSLQTMFATGMDEDIDDEYAWQQRLPGSKVIGILRLTGFSDVGTDLKAISVISTIMSRYTVVSVMDISQSMAQKLLLAVNGAGGLAFESRLVDPSERSGFKQKLGFFYRSKYVEFKNAEFYEDDDDNLKASVVISVFKLKHSRYISPTIALVSIISDDKISRKQMIKMTSHAHTIGEEVIIGGDFQVELPKQSNMTEDDDIIWWNGEQYEHVRTPRECPGCVWSCKSCNSLGYPMEGLAGDETVTSDCPYCRNFTWLVRGSNERQAVESSCENCKMAIKGDWLMPRVSPGASRVWQYENEIPIARMGASMKIRRPIELLVSLAASHESPPEYLIENPEYDRDPANRLNNKKNLLAGFFAFANPDDSHPISEPVKELLRKIIDRSDLMMVSNMPKDFQISSPEQREIVEKRSDGTAKVTASIFYNKNKISVEEFVVVPSKEFTECPPAAALLRLIQHPEAPPIGLLILYGTKTLLKASALTEVYADAKKKLEFQENITDLIIAGDFNIEHPEVPKLKPLRIPWYDGQGMRYLSTPEDCFCPWVCPCARFKYLVSVSGEGKYGDGQEPYTKNFMWLQKTTEISGVGGGGLCNVPFGKMIVTGNWLQSVVYAGTARVHVLDVSYRLPPGDPTALQIEYPLEVVLRLGGNSGPGPGHSTPVTPVASTPLPPGGTGSGNGGNRVLHLSGALAGTMCNRFKTMKFGEIQGKDSDVIESNCWFKRECQNGSPASCGGFSKHKCRK